MEYFYDGGCHYYRKDYTNESDYNVVQVTNISPHYEITMRRKDCIQQDFVKITKQKFEVIFEKVLSHLSVSNADYRKITH